MQLYVVERFVSVRATDMLAGAAQQDRAAAAVMTEHGFNVRHVQTLYLPLDETCFSVFAARSQEQVREANERAHLPYGRILEAVDLR